MAQPAYYQTPYTYVSVTTHSPVIRGIWITEIKEWAAAHNIKARWIGEVTHHEDGNIWHRSTWSIPDQRERTMFLLRWSN